MSLEAASIADERAPNGSDAPICIEQRTDNGQRVVKLVVRLP